MQIDGVLNFREVANLVGAGGRTMRRGQLFRSGSFAGITAAGLAQLSALGISQVIDLRNAREKRSFDFSGLQAAGVTVAGLPHALELGELASVLRTETARPQDVVDAMTATYAKLPFYFADIYRELFRICLQHNGPIVVNCSVGKDRTGVAIALLLSALDVPRADIVADYDKTNAQQGLIRQHLRNRPGANRYAQIPDAIMDPVLHANPRYLNTMFDAVEARAGSAKSFVADVIGLGHGGVAALQARFLQS